MAVGGKDRTILIYLKPAKMEARHLSATDVIAALKKNNQMVTPGIAYFGENQLLLDSNMMANKIDELMDVPIRAEPGNNVFLRDIGHIRDSSTIQTSRVRIASEESDWHGRNQVYVPIYRQQGASSLEVADEVYKHLPAIEAICPPGTKLKFVMDQTIFVRQAIHSLIQEGIVGAILVSIMILIFLGNWRMTLIASMSIPLALLGAIIGLYVTGNTINAMTLGGLALAIGPLVDDAIVELENNHRNYSLGKSRVRAALDGCAEVMVPVLVATFTTNIVLAPVALQPGMGGFLFRPLALAVAFAMFSSFLLSRTFVPMMCAKFLPDDHRRHAATMAGATDHHNGHAAGGHGHDGHVPAGFFGRAHHRIEKFLDAATRVYQVLLRRALRHRFLVLGCVLFLFLGSLGLTPFIGREFFPQVDAGQITVYLRAPSNMRLNATTKRVAEFEAFIKDVIPTHEMEMIVSEIGLDPDWSAAYTANSGQQDATVRIQLKEDRTKSSQEWAAELRRRFQENAAFNDLRVSFDTGGMVSTALNNGASSPIDIQVNGGSREQGELMARMIRNRVAGVPGVVDARVLQRRDAPYLVINVDRVKSAEQGLTPADVIQQAVAAMNSSISLDRNFWIDVKSGNQYFVAVQYPENPAMRLNDLLNVPVRGPNQKYPVKLSSLAQLERRSGAVEINHDSLQRVYNVQMNLEGRDIGHVAKEIETSLQSLKTPAGMHWVVEKTKEGTHHKLVKDNEGAAGDSSSSGGPPLAEGMVWTMRGEYERMNESFVNLAIGLAGASVLVYLLQVALFRSWVGPFIIMFTVPLGLIGVLTMLFVTKTTLNVQSEMGVIFLVGIAVNNGVLLVEFANKQRKAGEPVMQAIITAAGIRFRPILMTFLATFLDLIPMAIGLERGSEANVPLARAVVGGLLTSTCLTFFVVPIMYTLLIKDGADRDVDIEAELADEPAPLPVRAGAALVPAGALAGNGTEPVIAGQPAH